ncbi:YncE family protein [Bacillus ndiopicus]|uniref:YncE family protein n=1 Tax=Bacillus ndiopicus TaxID=1347368 RepID=UPI000B236AF4|nr:YncE family protein [Bacillus ndiopicus]
MMKYKIVCIFTFVLLLVGCTGERFQGINTHQSFVASMNILEPSLTFYDRQGELIANWAFEKAYTGAVLIQQDRVLLYGHQLTEADIYELSSGKKLATIETGIGTTNAYYAVDEQMIFLTNSRSNSLMRYNLYGEPDGELALRNYPMSMIAHEGLLYVVNYKDTVLSVVSIEDLSLQAEWPIEKSSHGFAIVEDTLLIGGHGEGMHSNETVKVLDLASGKELSTMTMPLMPIGFAQKEDELAVISHGSNMLYVTEPTGKPKWQLEVGANPFAVAYFNSHIIVAGYDDNKIYFIQHGHIDETISVDKGPFQLLVRGDS